MSKRKLENPIKIVIDESEKGGIYALGVLEITERQEQMLNRRFTALREKIKSRLIERKPNIVYDPEFINIELPELHGEALAQSTGYYRNRKNANKNYWMEHFEWYEEALKIIHRVNPKIYFIHMNDHRIGMDSVIKRRNEGIEITCKMLKEKHDVPDYILDNYRSLLRNQYIYLLPRAMVTMDKILRSRNKEAILICDNKDECKGFATLSLWDVLKERGLHANLSIPDFLSSIDEPSIQAIDLITYVTIQVTHMNSVSSESKNPGDHFKRMWYWQVYKKYIEGLDVSSNSSSRSLGVLTSDELAICTEMAVELSFKSAKIPKATLENIIDLGRHNFRLG